MTRYLFVGERRSARAKKLGVTWKDGALAAKPLFEALQACKIDLQKCGFVNLFEKDGRNVVGQAVCNGVHIVAMGQKVHKRLDRWGVHHVTIVHPAARGSIRRRDRYIAHVKDRLGGNTHGNPNDR